jgi:hypothetical protein
LVDRFRSTKDWPASRLTQLTIAALVSRMNDQTLKEELIRARLSHLGFDLEKDGFGWMVRDRREKLGITALQPIHGQNLDSIAKLFQIKLP